LRCQAFTRLSLHSSAQQEELMGSKAVAALYVAAMVIVIVGVDILVFRDRFWERLMSNVGIVLVFVAFYLRFVRRP
jgi:preprotein translocase subunit SecE